jgi:hypothetical protein
LFDALGVDGHVWGRARLFIGTFDIDAVESEISRICSAVSGETWVEVAEKLATFMAWEFDHDVDRK